MEFFIFKDMTELEIKNFEKVLENNDYTKVKETWWNKSDYQYYKAFYSINSDKKELLYQIFFEFWDFTKYTDSPNDWNISVTIMPESRIAGRKDLSLSVDWVTNLHKVEYMAQEFYKLVSRIDDLEIIEA